MAPLWSSEPVSASALATTIIALLPSASLIFVLGLVDDIYGVGPYAKLSVEVLAAVLLFHAGYRILDIPLLFGNREFGQTIGLIATVVWVILIMNAFNLIDGVDGLATGSALFSTVVVFIVSVLNGRSVEVLLTAVMSGALLGFLPFNFNPATIFLGDSGSLFVGFMLAALALGGQKSPTMIAVTIPVVSFGLPILETFVSVMRRFMNGKPLFGADREHFHHKLLKRGMSQRQVVLVLYAASGLFALLSLMMLRGGSSVIVVLIVLGAAVWVALQRLGYQEFRELRRLGQRTIEQKRVIVNNMAIRRGIERLSHANSFEDICEVLDTTFEENEFDAFELIYEAPVALDKRAALPMRPGPTGGLSYVWRKSNQITPADEKHTNWNLRLGLVVEGQRCGMFSLCRQFSDRPLLVDINLLAPEFAAQLTAALERATRAAILPLASGMTRAASAARGGTISEMPLQ
jgi:UDP-GlcNAc:undecaprenyl-phosphate GlcNAc-1-phosphate transferase